MSGKGNLLVHKRKGVMFKKLERRAAVERMKEIRPKKRKIALSCRGNDGGEEKAGGKKGGEAGYIR